jgi:hypothetical protein
MSAKYSGRPSYASIARRSNQLHKHSNKETINWINQQLERLAPNEHFTLEPFQYQLILEGTLRNRLSCINKKYGFNLKLHKELYPSTHRKAGKPNPNGKWYIWYCPDSRKFNRHGQVIDPTKPKQPKPKQSLQSSGSIHATTDQVLSNLNMTASAFDALPFDQQMKLRISTGIALRDQRTKVNKLNQIFKPPTNVVGN